MEKRLSDRIESLSVEKRLKRYVRTKTLSKMLGISASSLQNFRVSHGLPFIKVAGTIFYDLVDVENMFKENKFNTNTKNETATTDKEDWGLPF